MSEPTQAQITAALEEIRDLLPSGIARALAARDAHIATLEARLSLPGVVDLDEITGALLAANIPEEHLDGTPASLTDRILELASRYQSAKLLAQIAGYKLRDVPADEMPKKEGDPMPPAVAWVCRVLSEMIEANRGAANYLGWGWTDVESRKSYYVRVQRAGGKTPEMVASEAREDCDTATARAEKADAESTRLRDLVRHQRGPLRDADLITDAEYAALVADHGAVARLEGYDAAKAQVVAAEKRAADAVEALRLSLESRRCDRERAEKAERELAEALATLAPPKGGKDV